jgi:hypothetical protein
MVIASVMTRLEPDYRLSGQALCRVAFSIFDISVCLIGRLELEVGGLIQVWAWCAGL